MRNDDEVMHCFALNGNIFDPEVIGIDQCINVYQSSLQRYQLFGPTWFSSVLDQVNNFVESKTIEESQYNQKYNILLILTDGEIMDLQKTIDQIVRGSELPLSVIIVGVGNADFTNMDKLDADVEPLYSDKYRKF